MVYQPIEEHSRRSIGSSTVMLIVWALAWMIDPLGVAGEPLSLQLSYQQPLQPHAAQFHRKTRHETWEGSQTAVIICDMWDSHHCVNAVRRATELAPRIDAMVDAMRKRGGLIVHAPSSCMKHYDTHPARERAKGTSLSKHLPPSIESWCDRIPSEEMDRYPLDQSEGGEDDDADEHRQWASRLAAMGRNPKSPWIKQIDTIRIDEAKDYISDDGKEIWSILEKHGIKNVLLVGVHTNMCVLGRPFGLRRLASNGLNVALVRDLTDTMYDPKAWPYVSHFTGTDLIVQHIERYVCPTVASDQILGGKPFRFYEDRRPRLAIVIAEDEYKTEETLPAFAAIHLHPRFSVDIIHGSLTNRSDIPGLDRLKDADAVLVSVRRRPLSIEDTQLVRQFIAQGKPVIGIRTASHAFSVKDKASEGLVSWTEFDADVLGGNYRGHYAPQQKTTFRLLDNQGTAFEPWRLGSFQTGGTLYKTAPLAAGTRVLLEGHVEGEGPHPVAWTFVRSDGGRTFYTSLGHADDFAQKEFVQLLSTGIHWACGLPAPSLEETSRQIEKYRSGKGKQRRE